MRFLSREGVAYAVAATVALTFAGCSGGSPFASSNAVPAMRSDVPRTVLPLGFARNHERPSWMKLAPAGTGRAGLVVAQFGGSSVLWYKLRNDSNAAPTTCEPADSTNGIRIDSQGNLWVPDGKADTTTEYAPHCGAAKLTIPDPTGEPADLTFDLKGNVYIMNLSNHSGPPTVQVYTQSGKFLRTLKQATFKTLFGVGTDRLGNVFVSNQELSGKADVVEFLHGKMPGKVLTGISLELPGVPVFDSANNLIISDWEALTLDVFAPPYTAAPKTFPIMGSAIWCPLGPSGQRIYCGDAQNGSIDVYGYPSGKYLYSFTNALSASALVTGVTTAPAAPY